MGKDNLATTSSIERETTLHSRSMMTNLTPHLMYLHGLWSSTNSGVHDSLRESLDQVIRTWGVVRSSLNNLLTTLLKGALAFNILQQ